MQAQAGDPGGLKGGKLQGSQIEGGGGEGANLRVPKLMTYCAPGLRPPYAPVFILPILQKVT